MKYTGDLQVMLEELAEWFHYYGIGANDVKIIMRHTKDDIMHCSFFADDIDGFGDIFFQEGKVLSEFDMCEKGYR